MTLYENKPEEKERRFCQKIADFTLESSIQNANRLAFCIEQSEKIMLKLYRQLDGILHYHEAWKNDKKIVEHFGIVGQYGETREHPFIEGKSTRSMIKDILAPAKAAGFAPIDEEEHKILIVEYNVDGFGTNEDLDKRAALQDLLDDILGWTGLGNCDGGSIGSGTMEAACFVVDFDIAKHILEEELKNTEFRDYSRIYLEE